MGTIYSIPHPGTKSINSQQCHMTQYNYLTVCKTVFACRAAVEGLQAGMKLPHMDTGQQGRPTLQEVGDLKPQQWDQVPHCQL
jgi:hypothetical protein